MKLLILILLLGLSCAPPFPSFLLGPTPTPSILNAEGVVQVVPPKNLFVSGLVWSPDGTKLAISYSRVGVESSPLFQIYTLDIQNGKMNLLEESNEVSILAISRILAWSPDGRIIFYANNKGHEGTWEINKEGETTFLSDDLIYFSPNGERVAFWKSEQKQNTVLLSLYVHDEIGRFEEPLFEINEKFVTHGPLEWSPDSHRILFTVAFSESSLEDMFNRGLLLNMIDVETKKIIRLTNTGQGSAIWWPPGSMSAFYSWSSDGNLVTYTYWNQQQNFNNGLYITRSDGSCATRLINSEDRDIEEVSWSPNGRWIAFAWNRGVYLLDTVEVFGKDFEKYYLMCP